MTSAGNIIAAGSLDAGLFYAEGWNGEDTAWQDASEGAIFDSDAWAPGETEIRYIKATNEGDIAFRYRLDVVPEGDAGTLAEVIDVYFGVIGEGGFAVVLKAAQNVEGAENELKTGVAVSGLAGMEGQTFATVEEAYEAGRQILLAAGVDDGDTLG